MSWHVIHEADLRGMLARVAAGENPDAVYAEERLRADTEQVEQGLRAVPDLPPVPTSAEPASDPCYVCSAMVPPDEGWRLDGKAWCGNHRPLWSHD